MEGHVTPPFATSRLLAVYCTALFDPEAAVAVREHAPLALHGLLAVLQQAPGVDNHVSLHGAEPDVNDHHLEEPGSRLVRDRLERDGRVVFGGVERLAAEGAVGNFDRFAHLQNGQ